MDRDDLVKDFLEQFDAAGGETDFPEFLESYRVISCAYDRDGKSCYLVADKDTDKKYLLKIRTCMDGRNVLEMEHQRILELAQSFPEEYSPSEYWRRKETEYLLRCYIQGMDLEKYQEKQGVLRIQEVLRIAIEICEAVAKLHALSPPVLHRDIKPKNLIMDYRGKVHLIDFETARNYKENKSRDTVFWGTEGNAAPEQYGCSQTDVRTDVYGIGKVLEFLYQENAGCQIWEQKNYRRLNKIIQKAIAFDPAQRYQSVSRLQGALQKLRKKVDERHRIRRLRLIGILETVAAVFLIFAAFLMGKGFFKQLQMKDRGEDKPWAVSEELPVAGDAKGDGEKTGEQMLLDGGIKEAVAAMQGKENLAEEEYSQITKVIISGSRIYGTDMDLQYMQEEMCQRENSYRSWMKGNIEDISELSKMKNLREVLLFDQGITDIRPLEGLPIEALYLSGNQIEDFSVVQTMEQLKVLCIADNPVSVLPDFSKCRQLVTLSLGGNSYGNLDFLENSFIRNLYLEDIYVKDQDFSVLGRLQNLYSLYSSRNQYAFYEELPKLTQIKGLVLWDYIGKDLSLIKSIPQIETLIVTGDIVESMEGVEEASNLRTMAIDWTSITDISPVRELHRLHYLKINGLAIGDYSPLFACDSLRTVSADPGQEKQIDSMGRTYIFQIVED